MSKKSSVKYLGYAPIDLPKKKKAVAVIPKQLENLVFAKVGASPFAKIKFLSCLGIDLLVQGGNILRCTNGALKLLPHRQKPAEFRIMHFLRYVLILLSAVGCHSIAQETPSCPAILNEIENNLPHFGVLKDSDGFVYVDLDDAYIHELIRFIHKDGFEEPPYFGRSDLVGAHITVASPDEIKKYGVKVIQECGEKIYFTPQKCQVVQPLRWQDIDEVYIIIVEAPQLDLIRHKYGLPQRKYDFHITLGVKPKMVKSA